MLNCCIASTGADGMGLQIVRKTADAINPAPAKLFVFTDTSAESIANGTLWEFARSTAQSYFLFRHSGACGPTQSSPRPLLDDGLRQATLLAWRSRPNTRPRFRWFDHRGRIGVQIHYPAASNGLVAERA